MPDRLVATPEVELRFWQRPSVRRIVIGFAWVAAVNAYGVAGYVLLGWKPFDALFMVAITISGVGFSEVQPLDSTALRIHTMMIIVLGMVALAYTLASFLQFLTEGEIRRLMGLQRVRKQIETLSGHTILVGYGRMGELVCEELAANGKPFVVIDTSSERIAEIERHGYLCILGDATEEVILEQAGIARAKTVVTAVSSDANSLFITLTARQLAHHVEIIARAEMPSSQKKLRQAGANHVVLPAAIGAHRIASLLTNPSAVEFAELVTQRSKLAIEMEEIPVHAGGPLAGLTPRAADIRRKTGVIVIAVKRADGNVNFPPQGDAPFEPGDTLVLLGRRENLDQFRGQFRVHHDGTGSGSGSGERGASAP
jgi:voltage-gated potassium channel